MGSEAWEFEESGIVTGRYKHDREAVNHQWGNVREVMLRSLQKRYGARFPNAMMRIAAWIETEESGAIDPPWDTWPPEDRPLVLRLKVTVR